MGKGRTARMQNWINYRIRVTIQDNRMFVGTFLAFDRHMNLAIADCEEFRKIRQKNTGEEKEIKRTLGFVMLRGENIISMTAEAPPPAEPKRVDGGLVLPGRAQVAGRGVPVAPLGIPPQGLTGPVRGVGGPAPGQILGAPVIMPPPLPQVIRPNFMR